MTSLRTSPIAGPALVLGVCLALILGAYGFQYIGGLAPCQLCYWQRYALYVAIPLAAAATLLAWQAPDSRVIRPVLGLAGLAILTGAGIAAFHAGVEFKWWPGPDTCSATELGRTGEEILESILNTNVVRCDEVPWSLFGISMAGYNFIISTFLGLYALGLALRRPPRP